MIIEEIIHTEQEDIPKDYYYDTETTDFYVYRHKYTGDEIHIAKNPKTYICIQNYINEMLVKIKTDIKVKIEQEKFARSVFRHEEKDITKAEQCTGSIMAYNNVIKLIDKYKVESEE